jgi:hypothetical protein
LDILKEKALCKLVEILIKHFYSSPGSGYIFNDEINGLLEEIKK